MNQQMEDLIKTLEPYFTEKAPFQLPENIRQIIVTWAPWVVLIVAILSILPLLALGAFTAIFAFFAAFSLGGIFTLLSTILTIISIIYYFMAYPGLKSQTIKGWNNVFMSEVFAVLSAIASFLASPLYGVGGLVSTAIGAVIGLYVLFQVKDYYTGKKKLTAPAVSPAAETPTPSAE